MTQLYAANTRSKGGLAARAKINRNILKRYTQQKDQDHVIVLAGELLRYKQRLTSLHIRDRDINTNEQSLLITCTKIAFKLCLLLLLVIPTLPGLVLFVPVFLVAHKYANKKAVFLTSISSFRVTGRDTIATWRLLASLTVAPPLYWLYTMALVSGVCLYHQVLHALTTSPVLIMIFALFVFVGLWMVTVISLFTGDLLMDTLSSLRRHILSISPSAIALKSLREQRARLKSKVVEFVNGTGPFAS
jgi:glycerol-3-phosphate O-acyltransferase/dihydroxyacetone phosphate acyltransferase